MQVDGKCLCGYLYWEAEIDALAAEVCNCDDCQVLSGSAFRVTAPVLGNSFRFLTGTPRTYVKTAESGNRRELAFCPECGTSVYSRPEGGTEGYFGLRIGSLRQKHDIVPRAQIWARSALPWTDDLPRMPKLDKE